MKKIYTSFSLLVLGLLLVSCNQTNYGEIITTDYVLYDFSKAIVEDHIDVSLLSPIGVDYHKYEPTSNDLVAIKQSKVFFFLGYEQNVWLTDDSVLLTYITNQTHYLNLSTVVEHHHEEEDEHEEDHIHGSHYWTDPMNAIEMIEHMLEVIIEVDPDNEVTYRENANEYIDLIIEADERFMTELANYQDKTFYYIGHHALQAFETHYGIDIIPMEDSIAPGADPTSQQVLDFIDLLQSQDIDYLFHQEVVSTYTAEVIANHAGVAHLLELHGYHQVSKSDFDAGITYVDLLNRNIDHLLEALANE